MGFQVEWTPVGISQSAERHRYNGDISGTTGIRT